jgi:hypothetical protein
VRCNLRATNHAHLPIESWEVANRVSNGDLHMRNRVIRWRRRHVAPASLQRPLDWCIRMVGRQGKNGKLQSLSSSHVNHPATWLGHTVTGRIEEAKADLVARTFPHIVNTWQSKAGVTHPRSISVRNINLCGPHLIPPTSLPTSESRARRGNLAIATTFSTGQCKSIISEAMHRVDRSSYR